MLDIPSIAASVPSLKQPLETHRYICSDQIAASVYLAYHLRRRVLIEGPPANRAMVMQAAAAGIHKASAPAADKARPTKSQTLRQSYKSVEETTRCCRLIVRQRVSC